MPISVAHCILGSVVGSVIGEKLNGEKKLYNSSQNYETHRRY